MNGSVGAKYGLLIIRERVFLVMISLRLCENEKREKEKGGKGRED